MFKLERFIVKQEESHDLVVDELSNGRKQSHWMWYTFPQYVGLGYSSIAYEYSIKSLNEAKAYLENSYLRKNIYELCTILLSLDKTAYDIFGSPDYLKLKSCMTLFDLVCQDDIFKRVLDKFYDGKYCDKTVKYVNKK